MRLSHNMASLDIFRTHTRVMKQQSKALEHVSSGYKVNTAKDDPNVIAQSERIRMQIRGLQAAGKNTQDGVSMLQTAEGGLEGTNQMLQRIRELVVQAGSGGNQDEDRQVIQNEIDQLVDGIQNVVDNTTFNGKNLLNKSKLDETKSTTNSDKVEFEMPIGANSGESVKIPIYDLSASRLGLDASDTFSSNSAALENMKSNGKYSIVKGGSAIEDALGILDKSIDKVLSVRSEYGALENRFEGTLNDTNEISIESEGADSRLRDADLAQEMIEYTKDNILLEAGNAIMAQTNKFPQEILKILENVRSR